MSLAERLRGILKFAALDGVLSYKVTVALGDDPSHDGCEEQSDNGAYRAGGGKERVARHYETAPADYGAYRNCQNIYLAHLLFHCNPSFFS